MTEAWVWPAGLGLLGLIFGSFIATVVSPDRIGLRGSARFTRADYLTPFVPETFRQVLDLRRFADAFATFEGDEKSCIHNYSLSYVSSTSR